MTKSIALCRILPYNDYWRRESFSVVSFYSREEKQNEKAFGSFTGGTYGYESQHFWARTLVVFYGLDYRVSRM